MNAVLSKPQCESFYLSETYLGEEGPMRSRICCVLRAGHSGSHDSHTERNWGGDHEILRLTDDDRRLLIAMRIACRLLHSVESAENPPLPDIAEIPSLREQVFSDLKKRQHTWS